MRAMLRDQFRVDPVGSIKAKGEAAVSETGVAEHVDVARRRQAVNGFA